MLKKQALFKGVIVELDIGEFFSDITVKFRNIEIRTVVPKSMVCEWGFKIGDKVYVFIENQNIYLFKR